MKKIFASLLMIICCMFGLVGCGDLQGTYWKATQEVAGEIFTSNNFVQTLNVDFNSNLDTIIASNYGGDYAELTNVLAPLFESAIYYAYNYYNDLLITPKNSNNSFKNQIKAVNSNLQSFKCQVENFNSKKQIYESYIDFSDEQTANSEIEKARLLLFKREYISLIESAYNLSESLYTARRIGYYDFSNYQDPNIELADVNAECSLVINLTNLEITNCAIQIVKKYNAKEFASNYKNYSDAAKNFYLDVVQQFNSKTLTPAQNIKEKLQDWKNVNGLFNQELSKFYGILNGIDFEKLTASGNNPALYAQLTNNEIDEQYAKYYLNFYKHISTMKTYCLNIFE